MQPNERAEEARAHWEGVYGKATQNGVSWYRPHLETSLRLIQSAVGPGAAILDVGGGHSTLADDLTACGYRNLTVCDISETALAHARQRLGETAGQVRWLAGDIRDLSLPERGFDLWHDRAVFHFFTAAEDRQAYVRQVEATVKPGGHVVIATFGPQGPMKCSGLEVCRYDADTLAEVFGSRFRLAESLIEVHETPFHTQQQFLYCHFLAN